MVESRRSSAVARAVFALNQIQPSFAPVPILLSPRSFSYSARFLSYSSRVTLEFDVRLTTPVFPLAFTSTAVLLLARTLDTLAFVFTTPLLDPQAPIPIADPNTAKP